MSRLTGQRPRLWIWTLVLAIAYNALVTQDLKLLRVPLKTYLLLFCLLVWAYQRRPWRHRDTLPRFTVGVLAVGIGVPIVWLGVAVVRHHAGDAVQRAGLTNGITEASHFLYLLIFFPLVDYARQRGGTRAHRIWLGPTLVTCVITLAIWTAWVIANYNYGGHQLTLLSGVIGPGAGPFRVQLVTQVMFIPMLAVVLAWVAVDGLTVGSGLVTVLLLGATIVAHTRGYWIGLLCVSGLAIVLSSPLSLLRRIRVPIAWLIVVGLALSQVAPLLVHSSSISEISLSTRVAEAHQLLRGARQHLIIGSGLGATLSDGYTRSQTNPWSFELTFFQILFELGIPGAIVVIALPLGVLRSLLRQLDGLRGPAAGQARIAIAMVLALLVSDATNPYLINSVGMLALAIACVTAELALSPAAIEGAESLAEDRPPATGPVIGVPQ